MYMVFASVDYDEVSDMTLNQRVALWLAADVFLLTPIREGLNLMPLVRHCNYSRLICLPP